MRHRIRSKATHTATLFRRTQTGTDEFDEPVFDHVAVTDGEGTPIETPVVYRPGGPGYVRSDTGVHVEQADTLQWPTGETAPQEGDYVDIVDVSDRLEVVSVAEQHGRHGLSHYTVEVEAL